MAEAQILCYCHVCDHEIAPTPEHCCPTCSQGFIEILDKPPNANSRDVEEGPFQGPFGPIPGHRFPQPPDFSTRGPSQRDFERQLFQSFITHTSLGQQPSSSNSSNSSSADEDQTSGTGRPHTMLAQFSTGRGVGGPDLPEILHQILMAVTGHGGAIMLGGPGIALANMAGLHGNPGDYAWGAGGLDEIITQLMNQLEGTGPPPATKEQLEKLETVIIGDGEKNMQCSVCISDYEKSEAVKKLPCQHLFHKECIEPWLQQHGTCPVCRKTLDGNDTTCDQNAQSIPETLESYGLAETSQNRASTGTRRTDENLDVQDGDNVPAPTLQASEIDMDSDDDLEY